MKLNHLSFLSGLVIAASLLSACNQAESTETFQTTESQTASPVESPKASPETETPPEQPRNADGLLPACEAYIERLKSCYKKLPAAKAATYRENLKETKVSLKEANTQACEKMIKDFRQTAKMLECE